MSPELVLLVSFVDSRRQKGTEMRRDPLGVYVIYEARGWCFRCFNRVCEREGGSTVRRMSLGRSIWCPWTVLWSTPWRPTRAWRYAKAANAQNVVLRRLMDRLFAYEGATVQSYLKELEASVREPRAVQTRGRS